MVGRFAVPARRLGVVLLHAAACFICQPNLELRRHLALLRFLKECREIARNLRGLVEHRMVPRPPGSTRNTQEEKRKPQTQSNAHDRSTQVTLQLGETYPNSIQRSKENYDYVNHLD